MVRIDIGIEKQPIPPKAQSLRKNLTKPIDLSLKQKQPWVSSPTLKDFVFPDLKSKDTSSPAEFKSNPIVTYQKKQRPKQQTVSLVAQQTESFNSGVPIIVKNPTNFSGIHSIQIHIPQFSTTKAMYRPIKMIKKKQHAASANDSNPQNTNNDSKRLYKQQKISDVLNTQKPFLSENLDECSIENGSDIGGSNYAGEEFESDNDVLVTSLCESIPNIHNLIKDTVKKMG